MNIAVIGLGLIGGSLAKSIKRHTDHRVFGYDLVPSVVLRAKVGQAIDQELSDADLGSIDLFILALYPQAVIDYLREHARSMRPGAIVMDTCGIKGKVCLPAQSLCRQHGLFFIGGHPMAGIERSGFDASVDNLFNQASMLIVPDPQIDIQKLDLVKKLFLTLGFGAVKVTTPEQHDHIIAYTSQLAHVVASAYIKSPTALEHAGFSAGSFRDMTRVATLHEGMWTELFLDNREELLAELDRIIGHLADYRDAIEKRDAARLFQLLREGREAKAKVNALPREPFSPF
jgi:prephenate dehydrogenase